MIIKKVERVTEYELGEICCISMDRAMEREFTFNEKSGEISVWNMPIKICPFCGVKIGVFKK